MNLYTTILRVRNLEESIAWYDRVLDMKLLYRDLGYPLVSVADALGNRLTLWEVTGEEPPVVPTTRQNAMVSFVTEDIVATRALLTERGADVSPINDYRTGVRSIWVYDPSGHALLVVQLLPE